MAKIEMVGEPTFKLEMTLTEARDLYALLAYHIMGDNKFRQSFHKIYEELNKNTIITDNNYGFEVRESQTTRGIYITGRKSTAS